jgi:site-specific DNA-methyltransferase (adenine-specific)
VLDRTTAFAWNVAQRGDALTLLQSLAAGCTPLVILDPQYRSNLNRLKLGNEGARQRGRCALPQMSEWYIDQCARESARQAHHKRIEDVLPCVDLIAWDNLRTGMGHRTRHRGSYLLVLQRPPLVARATWPDRRIWDRWVERIIRPKSQHPHIKPIGLIKRLIAATTQPGDLIIDPAAGSFVVMRATHELGREFLGCDLAYCGAEP